MASNLRSIQLYVRVLAAVARVPRTIADIAAELDVAEQSIGKVLRQMRGRAVHVDRYEVLGKGRPAAFWLIGGEGDAPEPASVQAFRHRAHPIVRVEMIAFLAMTDLLFSHPVSMDELQDAAGSCRSTCLSMVRLARALRIVRVGLWDRDSEVGDYRRYFEIAVDKNDVPKPKKMRRSEYGSRYWKSRAGRQRQIAITNALAANTAAFTQAA